MIDVGAHIGSTLLPYATRGWDVYAFEPEPSIRAELESRVGDLPNVLVDDRAVSDRSGESVALYTSDLSTGITSLHPFDDTHRRAATVTTITLADFMDEHRIECVDFVKIDTEGHDLFVLQGFPWSRCQPQVIVCEFEDRKTVPLGYEWGDMADYLRALGYEVFVSEWYPVVRYGGTHRWRRVARYPTSLRDRNAWGNLVAVLPSKRRAFVMSARLGATRLRLRDLVKRIVQR
jgi:FkbM family methyltransferase